MMNISLQAPIVAALAFVAASAAEAQEPDFKAAIARCAAVAGNLKRLECFDVMAKSAHATVAPEPVVSGARSASSSLTSNPIIAR
jgi:hypothetical protein